MRHLLALPFLALAACAATEPLPPAPVEVLVVVNATAKSLTVVPTGAPNAPVTIPLGATNEVPAPFAARAGIALVPLGDDDAVAVVDLMSGAVLNTFSLAANSGATDAAIIDDSIGYVAEPGLDRVARINYLTGDTSTIAVGNTPQALVYTRGRLFVLNGNLNGAGATLGASWLTVIDPVTNAKAAGIDSIPLLGPGNARSATVGADGLLYVMNAGDSGAAEGRLSIVNPVSRVELASFAGFGDFPMGVATGGDRLYVASRASGLMVFDTRERTILRGPGMGIGGAQMAAAAVDRKGFIYAVRPGECTGGLVGQAFVLRPSDFSTTGMPILLGECAIGALITTVPAAP